MYMKERFREIKHKYQNWIMPIALIGGFVVDIFTLNRIDQVFDNALLILHICLVGTSITLLFSQDTPIGQRILTDKRKRFLKTLMVFSFGALFSGFVIFYTRSGSIIVSWPFIITMLVLMLGTEFRKKYFHKLILQIVIFYLALLAWANFFVPVIIKKIGPWVFVLSTLVGTLMMFGFIQILKQINYKKIVLYRKPLAIRIFGILALFYVLYFTHIIPPVPLSLKFKAVYYDVTKIAPGSYIGTYEETAPLNIFQKRSRDLYWQTGQDLYVFTQVFAPTKLGTDINHVWEYYDKDNRTWITRDTISIPITGGRQDGYRGFSKKKNLDYGTWRVKTTTAQRQTLGIIRFDIIPPISNRLELTQETL